MPIINGISALWQIVKDIGKSTDIWIVDETLLGYANNIYKHIHNPGFVTPADGSVIRVTSAAGAGDFGAFVDVIAANQIDRAFDIHWLSITDVDAIGVYVIELHRLDGAGASEALLAQVPVTRTNNFVRGGEVTTQIPVQPPNARVGARMLKGVAGADFVEFIAHYHDYQ